jgi:hypothetical protein
MMRMAGTCSSTFLYDVQRHSSCIYSGQEKFEDTKRVIRSCKWEKDGQKLLWPKEKGYN